MSDEVKEEQKKKKSGKVIGLIAFIVSEIIVIFATSSIFLPILSETINIDFADIFFFQGTIFVTVWGSVAGNGAIKKWRGRE